MALIAPPEPSAVSTASLSSDAVGFLRSCYKLLAALGILGLIAAYVFTGTQIPQYRATATIEIQDLNENFLNREVSQVTPFSQAPVANDMQTQLRILQSGALVNRTLQSLPKEVQPGPRGVKAWLGPSPAKSETPEAAFERAMRNLQVRETRQSRIVDVSYESPDAAYAAAFSNSLAQHFIDQSIESRIQISKGTSAFLEKQLADAGAKMAESEHKLQDYARKTGLLVTTEEHRPDEDRFRQIQESLSKAQENRMMKQARMETAASAPLDSLDIPLGSVLRDFQAKLADLRRQRADLATVYTPDFDGVKRLDAQIARMEADQMRESKAILQSIKNDYADALRRERLLEESYRKQFSQVSEQAGIAIQYNILKRGLETHRDLYNNLLQRTAEAKVASALRASGARLVDPARTPRTPFKPNKILNMLWGGTAGALLGLVIAIARRGSKVRAISAQTVAAELGFASLGSVPKIARGMSAATAKERWGAEAGFLRLPANGSALTAGIAATVWNNDPTAENNAFRSIVTSILLSRPGGKAPRVIAIASAGRAEGKTTMVANLAAVLARTGRKVLVVDATPEAELQRVLEASNETGLQDILDLPGDHASLLPYVASETICDNVSLVTADSSLVLTPAMASILESVRECYDIALIDTQALDASPDGRILSRLADGVVLVVNHSAGDEDSRHAAVAAVAQRLRQDGATVIGSIANRIS